jgi:endonuclease YncB( thermonuclease family)
MIRDMRQAIDLLVSGAIALFSTQRRLALALALALCVFALPSSEACANEAGPPLTHPIWTLVPTHIDRDKETHIRIEPESSVVDHIDISADYPIRISPDGTFAVDGKPVQIFGLVLPARQKICETPTGSRWVCGVRSYAALTSLLATRVLNCERLSPLGASVMVVTCKAGTTDIAERMISDGWAEADARAGFTLKSLEAAARTAHLGLWRVTIPEF